MLHFRNQSSQLCSDSQTQEARVREKETTYSQQTISWEENLVLPLIFTQLMIHKCKRPWLASGYEHG